jgi:hypothetical protein
MNAPQCATLVEIEIRLTDQDGETLTSRCRLEQLDISVGSPRQFRTPALDKPLKGLLRKMMKGNPL